VTFLAVILSTVLLSSQPPSPDCADVASCRQAALDAASRQDFERFHDLAWRAVQKGRPNDPELMRLVARAQSLSGRPGDALVMLRRLAQMGAPTDARESDDFRTVRMLPGWPELEALIAQTAETAAAAPSTTSQAASAVAKAPAPVRVAPPAAPTKARAVPAPLEPAPIEKGLPSASAAYAPAPAATSGGEETLRLPENDIDPIGLAYDSASRRFVVGDRRANKLMVADEVFKRVNDLLSASSGGFGALDALEIDSRRGDLWVTSSTAEGLGTIHKLQLVSGRVLSRLDVPADLQPASFSDLLITDAGALMLVDSHGGRLFRVNSAGGRFDRPLALNLTAASSLALAGNTAYIGHQNGLAAVDLATGNVGSIRPADGVSLGGLRRLRWNRGALIGIQAGEDGTAHLVRIRLAQNRDVATAVDILDSSAATEGTALTISRDAAYYVAHGAGGPIIRRVPLDR
jgi:hypothetical protein